MSYLDLVDPDKTNLNKLILRGIGKNNSFFYYIANENDSIAGVEEADASRRDSTANGDDQSIHAALGMVEQHTGLKFTHTTWKELADIRIHHVWTDKQYQAWRYPNLVVGNDRDSWDVFWGANNSYVDVNWYPSSSDENLYLEHLYQGIGNLLGLKQFLQPELLDKHESAMGNTITFPASQNADARHSVTDSPSIAGWSLDDTKALAHLWGESDITDVNITGSENDDILRGKFQNFGNDYLDGKGHNDELTGYRGADTLLGGNGNDIIRAGNGRDVINGGKGADLMYGGFGLNTFEDLFDHEKDEIYIKSDQWAENWLYGKAENSPNGEKADKIEKMDPDDEIYIQGVSTSQLSFQAGISHESNLGETLSGIGIFADNVLEAVYVGDGLDVAQISSMTSGTL